MPTLAQRWKQEGIEEGIKKGIEQGIEKGIEKGFILDKQDVLIMLLLTRFGLEEEEKAVIRSIESVDKLNTALKMVLTAETGTEIIDYLNSESA